MKARNRLGYRIRSRREELGLTKSEFSRRVGVTPTAVHNWEQNGVTPRREMLAEVCRVLRVSDADLLEKEPRNLSDDGEVSHLGLLDAVERAKAIVASAYHVDLEQVTISIAF